ncbi:MEDS domain-containing protein [Thermosediminibacter oceani]|uniref:DNA binding domain protein, excisionase family n=1 Tax=Thermosediminibacter oceani (strain ATCC BAA-1034 / DSM 16646 / JW/IW-1228P) TaxID=555079 RepID=D9RY58_THEOJ|nr:MEDS domain-containing protein [Thermosediminibacter oceani]ADL08282.1 DNA binding domain protein, excisionase family [Thermosediminibacter oceani DSM 16646]
MNEELLTVEEVSKILRTTPNTIYRWLRAGKLPGVKLGKEWRIRKEILASKLNETNTTSIRGQRFWDKIGPHRGHVLAVTRDTNDLFDLEAEFFKKGLSRGFRLFKGCWCQKPDDVRRELSIRGLPIEELEARNILTIIDLTDYYNRSGKNGPVQIWSEEARKTLELGYKTMWGSASPNPLSFGGHFHNLIEFESSLDNALRKLPVVGICTYFFDDFTGDNFMRLIDLMNVHLSVIFYNNGSVIYLKNEPA